MAVLVGPESSMLTCALHHCCCFMVKTNVIYTSPPIRAVTCMCSVVDNRPTLQYVCSSENILMNIF
jgi:hypothetical protein